MLSNYDRNCNQSESKSLSYESLLARLRDLEIDIYSRRIAHVKKLEKRKQIMHKMVDCAFHDAYQIFEKELHFQCLRMRELQEDLQMLINESKEGKNAMYKH